MDHKQLERTGFWLLLSGCAAFVFVCLTFGLTGVAVPVALLASVAFWYLPVAIPLGILLLLAAWTVEFLHNLRRRSGK